MDRRLEARIHQAADEASFRFLVEGVLDYAIFMLDPSGHVLNWNAGAERIKHYAPNEIVGRHFSIFYTPEDQADGKPESELLIARRTGRYEEEGWRVRKDGSRFWANVVITALHSPAGDLRGFAKITRDLTERRVALEELRRSETRLRLLIESIQDYALFMLDGEGRVVTWNPGAERLTQYRAEEIVGKHVSVFYTQEDVDQDKAANELRTAMAVGRFEDEGWRVRKDGSRVWANVVVSPIRDETGEVLGFAKVVRDLTARREAEEKVRHSEERLRLLIDSVKDYAIFMLDSDGRIATWNAGARRLKQYEAHEIIGKHFSIFYQPEEASSGKCDEELRIATETGRFEEEGWRVRKDGTRFWANVMISAARDDKGQLVGFAKVTRDLTDRRRNEEENLRLVQAHEAVRLRDEFLSVASHELKTPLTSLQLQVGGLQRSLGRLEAEQLAKRVDVIDRQVKRLTSLINSLLDVSRATAGQMQLDLGAVDLVQLVEESVERLHEDLRGAGCAVALRLEPNVVGLWDRMRLDQVVTNLVTNALKYGAGKPVEVSLSATRDKATLVVRDHGIGIEPSEQQRIFQRFARAVSPEHYGGLGLGLWIVRELVEAMGGTVRAESEPGQGAAFIVELPRD